MCMDKNQDARPTVTQILNMGCVIAQAKKLQIYIGQRENAEEQSERPIHSAQTNDKISIAKNARRQSIIKNVEQMYFANNNKEFYKDMLLKVKRDSSRQSDKRDRLVTDKLLRQQMPSMYKLSHAHAKMIAKEDEY